MHLFLILLHYFLAKQTDMKEMMIGKLRMLYLYINILFGTCTPLKYSFLDCILASDTKRQERERNYLADNCVPV